MFRNISAWSIKHPIPVVLLFIILTLAGVQGFLQMRVNNFPDIDFPLVVVAAGQPGAAPPELESQVTRIIEDALTGLNGVRHVRSTVGDGVSNTSVEFEIGVDLERATNDVRNAVASVRADLPQDIPEPIVQRIDISGQPLITYVVRSGSLNPEQLSWFVDNDVSKRLLAIPGIAQVTREGGVSREIRVELDPRKLAAQGVTAAQVSQTLRSINADLPGGRATVGGEERAIRTLGGADTVEQLADKRVSLGGGRSVRLGDLGAVTDSWTEPRIRARFDGQEVVSFSMLRTRDGSEVKAGKAVRKAVEKLDAERKDLDIEEVTSTVQYVEASYNASVEALLLGAILAVAVVFLFLRDWRATLITATAIPLSLIPTFAILAPLDQTFNVVTLLALSLTIGILVDDAIVEIENIVRHMQQYNLTPYQASMEAADEIGLAVVATTATIIAVFAPVGFMPGVVGQFFKSFALAACVSVLFSLVVARMLTPLMSAYLLKRTSKMSEHKDPFWMGRYLKSLAWGMKHRVVSFIAGTVFFVLSIFVATLVPGEFIPAGDQGYSAMSVELPPGSTIEDTDAVVLRITETLKKRPEVKSVYGGVGAGLSATGPGGSGAALGDVRRAAVTANLVPKHDRELSQQEFEQDVAKSFKDIPGVRIRFGVDGSAPLYNVTLTSDDGPALARAARAVEQEMRGLEGLANVVNTADIARPEILVTPKPDVAARMGVSANDISQAVRVATLGDIDQLLPKFNLGDRQIPIRLRLTEDAREHLDVIENLRVPTASGEAVPLSAVANITFGAGPSQIDRLDRSRNATITAELAGMALGDADKAVQALPSMKNLPPGVSVQPSGDVEAFAELGVGFATAFLTGILLMYAVLVLLFKSFLHPITIQMALPLALGGAFFALLITGTNLSMPALIGLLMLMGIAAKNSILLVEYGIEARNAGATRYDAMMDAAHKRARPILMTTVAMGAGMLPVALGLGEDVEFRQPMAIAVIGGLITSTLLSLLFVPVMYTILEDIVGFARWLIRKDKSVTWREFKMKLRGPTGPGAEAQPDVVTGASPLVT
ncbi:efflux RND transporter permease subunit [Caulobacter sp. NIBR1757]|uniref:efflux RND transporter permease subunit n=1 Tax=Caulobacter sp. NIBR1757 TaxID=3016000 RepID=UPI0022F0F305|nr:efflux RND transporter permease subunit [Caulobacter sp. NIBR1757]WGM40431.1 Multidrug resistance protein MdtB [Caulobacter sp. NIBR1757]